MDKYYHVTGSRNVKSILRGGLVPRGVTYMWSSLEDAKSWAESFGLPGSWSVHRKLAILEVSLPRDVKYTSDKQVTGVTGTTLPIAVYSSIPPGSVKHIMDYDLRTGEYLEGEVV